jgi:hypothetical protein
MVIDIAEVRIEIVAPQAILAADEGVHDGAHVGSDLVELDQSALYVKPGMKDVAQHWWIGMLEQFGLDVPDLFTYVVEDGAVVVDSRVYQAIEQLLEAGDLVSLRDLLQLTDRCAIPPVYGDEEVPAEEDVEIVEVKLQITAFIPPSEDAAVERFSLLRPGGR